MLLLRLPLRHLLPFSLGWLLSPSATVWAFAAPPTAPTTSEILPALPAGPAQWTAHWITVPNAQTGTNLMLLARRSFTLEQTPPRANLFVTADTRYELYVNGHYVRRGPARSAAHHQSYDACDIARWLRRGRNVLAVRWHHSGLSTAYHEPPRSGLLAQLEWSDAAGRPQVLVSDATWKVRRDPAWDSGSPRLNHWVDAFVDWVDLRCRDDAWATPELDDTSWTSAALVRPGPPPGGTSAKLGLSSAWWPAAPADYVPASCTPPWVALVPRDLPWLRETPIPATRLLAAGPLDDPALPATTPVGVPDIATLPLLRLPPLTSTPPPTPTAPALAAFVAGLAPLRLNPDRPARSSYLIFDLGTVHKGHARLDLEGPAGTIVDVLSAPYLRERTVDPTLVNSLHAHRLVLAGRRQTWEAFFFQPTRYFALVVRGHRAPVLLHAAGVTQVSYPWPRRGTFSTPGRPELEHFWQAGAQTIDVITADAYTDNYRERRQYPQTSYYAALGNYAAFGDTFLQRRLLRQNAEEQEPNGNLPGYAPVIDGRHMPFLDAQFFWLLSWHDYLLHSGDAASTRRLLPCAGRVLQRLHELAGPDGLIADPPYPYWIDHAPLDRQGANFSVNALYLLTLEHYAETLGWLGEPLPGDLPARIHQLRTALRTRYWDEQRGLFADAVRSDRRSPRSSEHANALALALDIATPAQARTIVPALLQPTAELVPASSLFVYWTFVGLARQGHLDPALALLTRRFAHQLRDGNGSLWEEWHLDRTFRNGRTEKTTRADAQGECGVFPMALTRWVAGVEPTAPGHKVVRLHRPSTELREIRAVFPAAPGDLEVAWSNDFANPTLRVQVPPGMTVELDLRPPAGADEPSLWHQGQPVPASTLASAPYALTAGTHILRFPAKTARSD